MLLGFAWERGEERKKEESEDRRGGRTRFQGVTWRGKRHGRCGGGLQEASLAIGYRAIKGHGSATCDNSASQMWLCYAAEGADG
jgi:hypothetical protein